MELPYIRFAFFFFLAIQSFPVLLHSLVMARTIKLRNSVCWGKLSQKPFSSCPNNHKVAKAPSKGSSFDLLNASTIIETPGNTSPFTLHFRIPVT